MTGEGGEYAPIEHSWSVGVGRKSCPYNLDVLARLSAHPDWSAVFYWRKTVFHTPPVTLYIGKLFTLWSYLSFTPSSSMSSVVFSISVVFVSRSERGGSFLFLNTRREHSQEKLHNKFSDEALLVVKFYFWRHCYVCMCCSIATYVPVPLLLESACNWLRPFKIVACWQCCTYLLFAAHVARARYQCFSWC